MAATIKPRILYYEVRYRIAEIRDHTGRLVRPAGEWVMYPEQIMETSVTLHDLEPDTTYEMQLRAVNEVGPSRWSGSGMTTTLKNEAAS